MYYKNGRLYKKDFILNVPGETGEENHENKDHYKGKYRKGFKSRIRVYTYKNGNIKKKNLLKINRKEKKN